MPKDCNPKMRFFMKGFAEMFILAEVSHKPASGKELMDAITHITDGEWRPSPGAAYPLLRKMEKEGLVKSTLGPSVGRRQIFYSATPKGKGRLEGHREHIAEKSEKMFRMLMPLMMRILHTRSGHLTGKMVELSDLIMLNRTYMISLSDNDLEPELDRMIGIFTKLKKEREKKRQGK
jgi:DNA-binding PadR family transcriptional regulator